MSTPACPSRDVLRDFLIGKVSRREQDTLAAHLESCESCQGALQSLPQAADDVVRSLRQAPSDEAVETQLTNDELYRHCLERILALHPEVSRREDAASPAGLPVVLGEYQLIEQIGVGGMGIVYKAQHNRLHRLVAIKLLWPKQRQNRLLASRFQNEMRAIGKLEHPHLVRATDAGEYRGVLYLVMELLPGQDLARLARGATLPAPEACEIIRQAALGVQYAHEQQVIHRDVKPSNLLLTADGVVKVLDLGLALLPRQDDDSREELTGLWAAIGTLDYMSPEQAADSHAVDARTDIYSLGATLYRLLAGQPPYGHRESSTAKLLAISQQPIPRLHAVAPEISVALSTVVHRMLARDPAQRFATAREVVEALAPFARGADLVRLYNERSRNMAGRAAKSPPTRGLVSTRDFPSEKRAIADRPEAPIPAPSGGAETHRPAGERTEPISKEGATKVSFDNRSPGRKWWTALLRLAVVAALVVAGLTAYRVAFEKGVLLLEVDEEQFAVQLREQALQVEDLQTHRKYTIRLGKNPLPSGTYQILIDEGSGLRFKSDKFEIVRGDATKLVASVATIGADVPPDGPLTTGPGDSRKVVSSLVVERPQSVQFSHDGKLVAVAGYDGSVVVWDWGSGEPARMFQPKKGPGSQYVNGAAFSPDGNLLLACTRLDVCLWNLADRALKMQETEVHGEGPITCVAFSPQGNQFASAGDDKRIWLWDVAGQARLKGLEGHTGEISCLAFTPSGTQLLSAGRDRRVHLWDLKTGKVVTTFDEHPGTVRSVVHAAEGDRFVTACDDGGVRIWSHKQTSPERIMRAHTGRATGVALTPRGDRAISCGDDRTVALWDDLEKQAGPTRPVGQGLDVPKFRFIGHVEKVRAVACSPDGRHAVSASENGQVLVWQIP